MENKKSPERLGDILTSFLERSRTERRTVVAASPSEESADAPGENEQAAGRYDFDLAEFPLFQFYKNRLSEHDSEPFTYSDTIVGKDGQEITREWKAYPGPFGFGGASAHVLLFDLFQLYAEQGFRGSQIQ